MNLKKGEKLILAETLLSDFLDKNGIKKYKILEPIENQKIKELICNHPLKNLGFDFEVKIYSSSV